MNELVVIKEKNQDNESNKSLLGQTERNRPGSLSCFWPGQFLSPTLNISWNLSSGSSASDNPG